MADLVAFVNYVDFATILVKYISSKDFAKLSLVSREFNIEYILARIENDYTSLYFEFISERERYYPLIFTHHFIGDNAMQLAKMLAYNTICNLKSGSTMSYIPDKDYHFSPHDRTIRNILYQCFSISLLKPIQIVHEDGSISFDDAGSIISSNFVYINTDGEWVDQYIDGVYDKQESNLQIIYGNDGNIDQLSSDMSEHDEFYDFYYLFDHLCINPLFLLLHKFCIKLKNKLIVDRIVISPFEKQISISYIDHDLQNIFNTHHINCIYGNIEINLQNFNISKLRKFYELIALIPIGTMHYIRTRDCFDCWYYILGDEYNDYIDLFADSKCSHPNNNQTNMSFIVYYAFAKKYNELNFCNNIQPHKNIRRYDTATLFDYLPVQSIEGN